MAGCELPYILGSSILIQLIQRKRPEPYAPCILVVDDDYQVRRLVRHALDGVGYFVFEAENYQDAEEHLRERHFDILLTDLALHDGDGLDLVRLARAEMPRIRVVLCSGSIQNADAYAARSFGADAVVGKPFRPAEMFRTIIRLLL